MPYLKNFLYKSIFLLILLFSLVSCGSTSLFNKSPGNTEDNTYLMKVSQLESELHVLQEELSNLQLENENKDNTIIKLKGTILRLEKKINYQKNQLSKKIIQYKTNDLTPQVLYKKARNLLIEEDYVNAASLFSSFINNYSKDSLADNAVYWLGECHYSLGNYKRAIVVFKDLEKKYPKSEKAPDAILKTGYCYLSLDDTNRANHFLKLVLTRYPFSPASEKAQEKLKGFE
jgi:tol-pal system protein YbgF